MSTSFEDDDDDYNQKNELQERGEQQKAYDLFGSGKPARRKRNDLNSWIEAEEIIARKALLSNIGPIAGAKDGLVIASPSRGEAPDAPDYFVTFVLSFLTAIIDEASRSTHGRGIQPS